MEREVPESERRFYIKKKYLEKFSDALNKSFIDQEELYTLVRGFFSELLKIEYQFTYEELSVELNKVYMKQSLKTEVDTLLAEVSQSEYYPERELTQEEIKAYIAAMQSIVERIIPEKMLHGDRSFINRMLGKSEDLIISSAADTDTSVPDIQEKIQIAENIRPMSQAEIDTAVESTAGNTYEYNAPTSNKGLFIANNAIDMPSMPAADNTTNKSDESNEVLVEDNSKGLVSVHKFMEESYLNLDTGNIQEAKAGYTRALSTYHALSMADKRQTYIELYELYSRLKKI